MVGIDIPTLRAYRVKYPVSSKPGAVILRRDLQQAQKTAAHCFLRAQPATLRDPFDWQARLQEQTGRRFHSQPLDGTSRCLPGCLGIVPTETALAHPCPIGQDRKREIVREMAVDPVMQRAEFVLCDLQCQGSAELCLSAGTLEKNDQVAGYSERH